MSTTSNIVAPNTLNTADSNIRNKVVVITGASSGLGEITARHLAALGAHVVLGARRTEQLARISDEIHAAGGSAIWQQMDVTQPADVESLIALALQKFGRVDVMLNNAGYMAIAPLSALKTDEWSRMIDINIKGVLNGIAAALPVFQQQNSGHFINVASVAGIKVFSPGGTVYSGTKFAVRAITEGLRHEVGSSIRTTLISPGAVESELKLGSSDPASQDALQQFYQLAIPAETVARAVAYAMEQPAAVDISEIVLRPVAQEF
jgi:NADP-dependent 3-hydroxy acid dehydrogenase YdfG